MAIMMAAVPGVQAQVTHGVNRADMDLSVKPGDDFYEYAGGGWMKANPLSMHPEYASYGVFNVIAEENENRLRDMFLELGKTEHKFGTVDQKVADLYKMAMDSTRLNSEGAQPMMGDLAKNLNEEGLDISKSPVDAQRLGEMIQLIMKDTISGKIAKKVFQEMWTNTDSPEKIVKDKGLVQITDTKAIEGIVDEVIANNQKAVDDYKGGNKKAIGALVGQVMKASKGKANPQMVNKLLAEKLN